MIQLNSILHTIRFAILLIIPHFGLVFAGIHNRSQHLKGNIDIINAFSDSAIRVINFNGLNINFEYLNKPIILIRYFSFPEDWKIYPIEMSPLSSDMLSRLLSFTDLSRFKKLQILWVGNKMKHFSSKTAKIYLERMQLTVTKIAKNTNCETNVYLNPANQENEPSLHYKSIYRGAIVKDPFWIQESFGRVTYWKNDFITTTPKYSLLICNRRYESSCHTSVDEIKWMSGVLDSPHLVRTGESVLILLITKMTRNLYILCPFCDACKPFTLINLNQLPISKDLLNQRIDITLVTANDPHVIDVVVRSYITRQYKKLKLKDRGRKHDVLKIIRELSAKETSAIPFLADIHLLRSLLPKNSTILFKKYYKDNKSNGQNIQIDSYSPSNPIKYHPKLLPGMRRKSRRNLAVMQEIGLIFQQESLRFVSCHKEQLHWIHQLQHMVTGFDAITWVLLILVFIVLSSMSKYIQMPKTMKLSIPITSFQLFAAFVDQSAGLFGTKHLRINKIFVLTFFVIPSSFTYLGNLYKGDNITRLTLDPPLIPFNTFEKLISNAFKTYVRTIKPSENARKLAGKNLVSSNQTTRKNGHEAFPFVSELWEEIMNVWTIDNWRPLYMMGTKLSNSTWNYLNNSEMFPPWYNTRGDPRTLESINEILKMHMGTCSKAAVILPDKEAELIFGFLTLKKMPAYFGEDFISKTLNGYKYFGKFPDKILWKAKHLFSSGVLEWWRNFFKWSQLTKQIPQITRIETNNPTLASFGISAGTRILSLCFLPLNGIVISIVTFVLFEINFCGNLKVKLSNIFKLDLKVIRVPCTFKN